MSSAADRRRAAAEMVPRPEEQRTARLGGSPAELEIRSDACRILDETVPLSKDKLMEMYHICAKADKLEAFVRMVAHRVSFLEDQVLEAGKTHSTFLNTICKLVQRATISSLKNSHPPAAPRSSDLQNSTKTFPINYVGTKYQSNYFFTTKRFLGTAA